MSRYIEYTLEASDVQSIALPQSIAKDGDNLVLNGKYGGTGNNVAILAKQGFSYYVSLTSSDALAGVNFTVTGYHNNRLVTLKDFKGPNQNTVTDDTTLFDSIISITASLAILAPATVSVGTLAGVVNKSLYSLPIMIDFPYRKGVNCFVSVAGAKDPDEFNADYNLYGALGDIRANGQTISSMITSGELIKIKALNAGSPFYNITEPFKYCVVEVIPTITPYIFPATTIRFSQSN